MTIDKLFQGDLTPQKLKSIVVHVSNEIAHDRKAIVNARIAKRLWDLFDTASKGKQFEHAFRCLKVIDKLILFSANEKFFLNKFPSVVKIFEDSFEATWQPSEDEFINATVSGLFKLVTALSEVDFIPRSSLFPLLCYASDCLFSSNFQIPEQIRAADMMLSLVSDPDVDIDDFIEKCQRPKLLHDFVEVLGACGCLPLQHILAEVLFRISKRGQHKAELHSALMQKFPKNFDIEQQFCSLGSSGDVLKDLREFVASVNTFCHNENADVMDVKRVTIDDADVELVRQNIPVFDSYGLSFLFSSKTNEAELVCISYQDMTHLTVSPQRLCVDLRFLVSLREYDGIMESHEIGSECKISFDVTEESLDHFRKVSTAVIKKHKKSKFSTQDDMPPPSVPQRAAVVHNAVHSASTNEKIRRSLNTVAADERKDYSTDEGQIPEIHVRRGPVAVSDAAPKPVGDGGDLSDFEPSQRPDRPEVVVPEASPAPVVQKVSKKKPPVVESHSDNSEWDHMCRRSSSRITRQVEPVKYLEEVSSDVSSDSEEKHPPAPAPAPAPVPARSTAAKKDTKKPLQKLQKSAAKGKQAAAKPVPTKVVEDPENVGPTNVTKKSKKGTEASHKQIVDPCDISTVFAFLDSDNPPPESQDSKKRKRVPASKSNKQAKRSSPLKSGGQKAGNKKSIVEKQKSSDEESGSDESDQDSANSSPAFDDVKRSLGVEFSMMGSSSSESEEEEKPKPAKTKKGSAKKKPAKAQEFSEDTDDAEVGQLFQQVVGAIQSAKKNKSKMISEEINKAESRVQSLVQSYTTWEKNVCETIETGVQKNQSVLLKEIHAQEKATKALAAKFEGEMDVQLQRMASLAETVSEFQDNVSRDTKKFGHEARKRLADLERSIGDVHAAVSKKVESSKKKNNVKGLLQELMKQYACGAD